MEGVDIAGIVVASEGMDALAHLTRRLVGEGDAQDVARQDAQLVHQIGEAVGEGPGLAGARPGHHPDNPLGGGDSLPLGRVEPLEQISHGGASPFLERLFALL